MATPSGVHLCELSSEEADHRGIIDPDQLHCQESRRAETPGDASVAEIKADAEFPRCKECACDDRTQSDIAPAKADIFTRDALYLPVISDFWMGLQRAKEKFNRGHIMNDKLMLHEKSTIDLRIYRKTAPTKLRTTLPNGGS